MCAHLNSRKGMKVCGERPLNDTALERDFLDKLDRSIYAEMLRDYCNGLVTKVTTLEEAYQLAKKYVVAKFSSFNKSLELLVADSLQSRAQ